MGLAHRRPREYGRGLCVKIFQRNFYSHDTATFFANLSTYFILNGLYFFVMSQIINTEAITERSKLLLAQQY